MGKALEAVKSEAAEEAEESTMVTFEYDGEEYTYDSEDLDDVDILEAWEQGKTITLLRLALGEAQWMKFKRKRRRATDIEGLSIAAFATKGVTPGE